MATKIKLRGDTAANWAANNPLLEEREMGIETNTNNFKFGNGTDRWNSLEYVILSADPGVTNYNDLSNKPMINSVTLTGNKTTADLGITEGTTNYNNLSNMPQINGYTLCGNKTTAELGIVAANVTAYESGNDLILTLGYGATNPLCNSMAIGINANMGSIGGITIGNCSTVDGNSNNSLVIGSSASVLLAYPSIAIGYGARVQGCAADSCYSGGIAIGYESKIEDASTSNIAIGYCSSITGRSYSNIAIGDNVAILNNVYTSVAIGYQALVQCNSGGNVIIGASATNCAYANNTIAIGSYANAWYDSSIAIGACSYATACNSIAIGTGSNNSSPNSIAILGNACFADGFSVWGCEIFRLCLGVVQINNTILNNTF